MAKFSGKVLMVGYGSVAQCTLPLLLKLAKVPAKNITVMDFEIDTMDSLKAIFISFFNFPQTNRCHDLPHKKKDICG